MGGGIAKEAKAREGAPWLNTMVEAVAGCRNYGSIGQQPQIPSGSIWRLL